MKIEYRSKRHQERLVKRLLQFVDEVAPWTKKTRTFVYDSKCGLPIGRALKFEDTPAEMMLFLGRDDDRFPYSYVYEKPQVAALLKPFDLKSWIEEFIMLACHEARHVQQYNLDLYGRFSTSSEGRWVDAEVDAQKFAVRMVRVFRLREWL